MYNHTPVLLSEILEYLDPKPGDRFVDATLGGGGYTFALAEKVGPDGRVLGIDLDELALSHAKLKRTEKSLGNVQLTHANFKDIADIARAEFGPSPELSGVVFDLGLSSAQLEDRDRGFSFGTPAPLTMAFGSLIPEQQTEWLVNERPVGELAKLISRYGEERYALSIAKAIVARRREKRITTTDELVEAIRQGTPPSYRHGQRLHFATRTFQALRIATNDELGNLESALAGLKGILKPGGRIVIVSFHSLEDRIVKNFFRRESRDCVCPPELPVCRCGHTAWLKILTRKAVAASESEIENNPRARSAKLRAAEVIAHN